MVMGPVQNVPFVGKDLNTIVFPVSLCIIALLTFLNLYNYLLICFGSKKVYRKNHSNTNEKIEEGRFIIEKYKSEKLIVFSDSVAEMNLGSIHLSTADATIAPTRFNQQAKN